MNEIALTVTADADGITPNLRMAVDADEATLAEMLGSLIGLLSAVVAAEQGRVANESGPDMHAAFREVFLNASVTSHAEATEKYEAACKAGGAS